jgi:uncharacterized protein (TIGR03067 family)
MRVVLACGLAGLLLVSAASGGGDAKGELDKFKGMWVGETDGKKVELKLTATDFDITFDGTLNFKGTFKIDPSKKPKQVDMTVKEGGMGFDGKTALGVYELDGDTLKWCTNFPGADNRPKGVDDKEGHMAVTFKRAK